MPQDETGSLEIEGQQVINLRCTCLEEGVQE
jgi:hypothetical protein